MRTIPKPQPGEYAPYAIQYIGLLPDDGQVLKHLAEGFRSLRALLAGLPEERLLHRYGPGKWSVKEVVQHISDDERIYAYRALRFARGDTTELPGFEQEPYAEASEADRRSIASLLAELGAVRRATIQLFAGLPHAALVRQGVANGNPMSVRAAVYHIAGHELHHVRILRESYLLS
jgi:uncharacterized damage-inducible protein DinB